MALDDILIKIGAKDEASKVFGKVGDNVDKFGKRFGKSSDGVVGSTKRMLTGFKGLIAGVGILAALRVGMAKLDDMDNLAKTSQKLGVTANELLALRMAAEQFSGAANSTLDMALQRMTRRISEAAIGTGEAQKAIKELGLEARALNNAGPAQAFRMLADAIQKVENPADRLRLTVKFLDSEGGVLATTLAKGAAGLDAMAEKSRRLNGDLSAARLEAIERANDAISDLKTSVGGLGSQIALTTAGPLAAFINGLSEVIAKQREIGNKPWLGTSSGPFGLVPGGLAERLAMDLGERTAFPAFGTPESPRTTAKRLEESRQEALKKTLADIGVSRKAIGSVGFGPFEDVFALEDSLRDPLQRMLDSLPKYDPFEDIFPADRARPFFDKLRQQMRNALPKRDRAAEFSPILARNMQAKRARQEAIEMFGPGVFESPSQRPELGAVESRLLSGRSADSKTLEESRKQTKELREIRDLAREEKRRAQAEKQLDRLIVELAGE